MKTLKVFGSLVIASFREVTQGSRAYNIWMAFLTFVMLFGMFNYGVQLDEGLSVTGMTDRVSWGLYISNSVHFKFGSFLI